MNTLSAVSSTGSSYFMNTVKRFQKMSLIQPFHPGKNDGKHNYSTHIKNSGPMWCCTIVYTLN